MSQIVHLTDKFNDDEPYPVGVAEDGVWVYTKDCNVLVRSSEKVLEPTAVRYAYRNHSVISVYNAFGIPASPFRTDTWGVESLL